MDIEHRVEALNNQLLEQNKTNNKIMSKIAFLEANQGGMKESITRIEQIVIDLQKSFSEIKTQLVTSKAQDDAKKDMKTSIFKEYPSMILTLFATGSLIVGFIVWGNDQIDKVEAIDNRNDRYEKNYNGNKDNDN